MAQPEIDKLIALTNQGINVLNGKIEKKLDMTVHEEREKIVDKKIADLQEQLDKISKEKPTSQIGEAPEEMRLQALVTGFYYGTAGPEMTAEVTMHLTALGIQGDQVKMAPNL